jgi:hypothetical protein
MNIVPQRWRVGALEFLLFTVLCACLAGGGYIGGYSEPYGSDYGGWGRGYHVGPPRGGERRPEPSSTHAYRPAPSSRSTPSIPTRPRRP